ncbi:MAG: hypothetical protein ACNYPH_06450 [Gammaproteobacteria bacterium WSBS_2016_MAG_OTU1]
MKSGIVTILTKLTILAGLILNPLAAFATDKNGVSKEEISLSAWKKDSLLTLSSAQNRTDTGFFNHMNFDEGNFDYFNAADTGGFFALNEISTSHIFVIGALVVDGITEDKKKSSTASTSPTTPTPDVCYISYKIDTSCL